LRAVDTGDVLEILIFVGAFGAAALAASHGSATVAINSKRESRESPRIELLLGLKAALTTVNPK
jgi:hypothetical protein